MDRAPHSHLSLPIQAIPTALAEIEGLLGQPVGYRGFVLIPQTNLTWLIRPERSPMRVLPFRVLASSLSDVRALIDWRFSQDRPA
jgi:hypothetical protein